MYESNSTTDHNFFFSFFASERAALELWSDAVEEHLRKEMQKGIDELSNYYQNSLNKLQRQNWRRRVESERMGTFASNLLSEFADVIAHKALIDARISVLSGEFSQTYNEDIDTPENCVLDFLESSKFYDNLENSGLVQINQSLEAEFKCILNNYSDECRSLVNEFNLKDVIEALQKLAAEVFKIEQSSNPEKYTPVTIFEQIHSWKEVCQRCEELQNRLASTRINMIQNKM